MQKLLTIGEASRLARCAPQTLDRGIKAGRLPAKVNIYGLREVDEADVIAFAATLKRRPGPVAA
jgi:hypothetical protein